jgi:hypothetical protein
MADLTRDDDLLESTIRNANCAIDVDDVKVGDSITWEESKLDGRDRAIHHGKVVALNDEYEVSVQSFDFERDVDVRLFDILTINGKEV